MNALVIDVKGDSGFIPFKVDVPLAEEVGAQKIILNKDYPAFIKSLKDRNLYLIARIVTFKDNLLATAKPQWAVKTQGGGIFRDRERLRWADAFHKETWDYNIAIAKAVADLGFDEIQFDYVRLPDNRGVVFPEKSNIANRTRVITGFLEAAYKALIPYNVFVAADVFGYVPWNEGDTGIGQAIVPVTKAVDIISLMTYPSGYHLGIPKYRNPVQHPYEVVYLTQKSAIDRTKASPLHFRPWLQAFRDYAYGGGNFTEERMPLKSRRPTTPGPAAGCSGTRVIITRREFSTPATGTRSNRPRPPLLNRLPAPNRPPRRARPVRPAPRARRRNLHQGRKPSNRADGGC